MMTSLKECLFLRDLILGDDRELPPLPRRVGGERVSEILPALGAQVHVPSLVGGDEDPGRGLAGQAALTTVI